MNIMHKIKYFFVLLGLCISKSDAFGPRRLIETIYQWKQLEFDFENETMRSAALKSGDFIPNVPLPMDVDVHYERRLLLDQRTIFITIPRLSNGNPASLGIVTDKKYNQENLIKPYPSWSWHRNPKNCNRDRLVSVYRTKIDECGRLWALDTGKIGDDQICPPQLVTFNLKTNQLVNRIEIPQSLYDSRSLFVSATVDVRDPSICDDTFVYIADELAFSIVVYDMRYNQLWKVTDKTMDPNPNNKTFVVDGQSIELMYGVGGMALEPLKAPKSDRILYYHAVSSVKENWVYTSFLRNQSLFTNNAASSPDIFHTYSGTGPSQVDAMAMNKNGIIFFGLISQISINCWNTLNDYGGSNIHTVYQNTETMQTATGVKVIDHYGENLWLLTNRFQKLATGTLSPNETNFRISVGSMTQILWHTACSRLDQNKN